jgi:hypothetical protein
MATPTAANVRVGSTDYTGGVFSAPTGTTLPTTATGSLAGAFTTGNVGLISDGGVTQSIGNSTTDIKAWHNNDTVRTIQTDSTVTYQFEMIETNAVTLGLYYGTGDASSFTITGGQGSRKSFVIQVIDETSVIRIVIPDGQITARGDTVFSGTDILRYPITITAYPDASGNKAYGYLGTGS